MDDAETRAGSGGWGGNGESGGRLWEWMRWKEIGRDDEREGARDLMVGGVRRGSEAESKIIPAKLLPNITNTI